jgi:hypothetical protein
MKTLNDSDIDRLLSDSGFEWQSTLPDPRQLDPALLREGSSFGTALSRITGTAVVALVAVVALSNLGGGSFAGDTGGPEGGESSPVAAVTNEPSSEPVTQTAVPSAGTAEPTTPSRTMPAPNLANYDPESWTRNSHPIPDWVIDTPEVYWMWENRWTFSCGGDCSPGPGEQVVATGHIIDTTPFGGDGFVICHLDPEAQRPEPCYTPPVPVVGAEDVPLPNDRAEYGLDYSSLGTAYGVWNGSAIELIRFDERPRPSDAPLPPPFETDGLPPPWDIPWVIPV